MKMKIGLMIVLERKDVSSADVFKKESIISSETSTEWNKQRIYFLTFKTLKMIYTSLNAA
jgi:hypothetical protein